MAGTARSYKSPRAMPSRPACEHVFVRWGNLTIDADEQAPPARLPRRAPSSAASTLPRRSTPASTRSARSPRSTASRTLAQVPFRWTINPYRGCSHACHLLLRPARPTSTSTSTRAATSRRRSSSRSTCPRCCGSSWRGRRGRASTSRWGRTPTRTSGSRARYKLMRGIWEAMRDFANPCSVLTKSPLLLRDLDLMQEIAARHDDQREPLDPDDGREGVAGDRAAHAEPAGADGGGGELNRAGHPVRDPRRAAHAGDQRRPRAGRGDPRAGRGEAGATGIGGIALHLRGEVRGVFMEWLRSLPARPRAALRGALRAAARTRRGPSSERLATLLARRARAALERRATAPAARGGPRLRACARGAASAGARTAAGAASSRERAQARSGSRAAGAVCARITAQPGLAAARPVQCGASCT